MINLKDIEKFIQNISNITHLTFIICNSDGTVKRFIQPDSIKQAEIPIWENMITKEEHLYFRENVLNYMNSKSYMDYFKIKLKIFSNNISYTVYFMDSVETNEGNFALIAAKPDMRELSNVQFISMISHELRTPLTSILGTLSMLKDKFKGDNLIEAAYTNSEKLSHLIDDLLNFQSLEMGRMTFHVTKVNLYQLVSEAVYLNKTYADRYKVTYKLSGENNIIVMCDYLRTTQIVNNYLSNAAKFSTEGGIVDIIVKRKDSNTAIITVQDYGEGIDDSFKQYVFERYAQSDSTVKKRKGGTGLGLYITKLLSERQGGTVGFSSELGKGSIFYATLPIYVENKK